MGEIETELQNFRQQIDAIDDELLTLIAQRNGIVQKVGALKEASGADYSIIRPGREASMVRRVCDDFTGSNKAAIAHIWRMLISSSVNIEEDSCVSALASHASRESFWVAREYFGPFTPMRQQPTVTDVLFDVINRKATVGVIPFLDDGGPHPWWQKLCEFDDRPAVFATLPFVRRSPSNKPPLVAIGYVAPEPTGDDSSLWVIRAPVMMHFSLLSQLLDENDLPHVEEQSCRFLGTPAMEHYLMRFPDFVGPDDARITSFVKAASKAMEGDSRAHASAPVSAYYLGAYANPLRLFDGDDDAED